MAHIRKNAGPANMPSPSLTLPVTNFVGREHEMAAILKLLADPACRLLTLTGVGGIGKTQLALRVYSQLYDQLSEDIYWVDLQPLQSGDYLIPAIADAVGLTLSGQEQLQQQLCRYMETKRHLLVLDNFEHLLEHVDLLPEIMQRAPDIRLLVTSREALNLHEEWLYPLTGLNVPESQEIKELEAYDAIRLFVERAQRMRPDFSLTEEREGVIRICQLVEGMPLAIEMAAAWTKSLRCSAIAAEIQRNLNFLTSRLRDVSERHRSMEAVFAQTWARLTSDERTLFKRLAVFRGGFQAEAAQTIAGASLQLLASLSDKSLLRCDTTGRYHLHELLRQYAESRLEPDELQQAAVAHCQYYSAFLDQRQYHLVQGEQARSATEVETELENIRSAWQAALQEWQPDAIQILAATFFHFGQLQARHLEVLGVLEQALPVLEAHNATRLLAQVFVHLAWMLIRLGRLEQAARILAQSRAWFEELDITPVYGMGTHPLAPSIILQVIRGNYADAVRLGDQFMSVSARSGDLHAVAFAYYGLTSAHFNLGHYEQAYQCAQKAVTLSEAFGNRWFMAYCLNEWGSIARAMGNYGEAEQHYRASYQIRQGFRDPEGIAVVLNHFGELALLRQDYPQARELYEKSLGIYQNLNDQGGLATVHHGLGKVAAHAGEFDQAIQYLSQALTITTRIQFVPLTLSVLIDVGNLLLQSANQTRRGIELLTLVLHHPASSHQQREQTEALLGNRQSGDPAHLPDLNKLLPKVQAILTGLTATVAQPLVKNLTEREREILQLLVSGMSNAEIGDQLFITVGAVKAHTSRIYGKLGVRNRVEAIAKGRELSLFDHL